MNEKILKSMEADSRKRLEHAAKQYPDIKLLLESYDTLVIQGIRSEDFLNGYQSTISDLIYIKQLGSY